MSKREAFVKNISHEERIDLLERKVALLQANLLQLAARCWEACGTDFIKTLSCEIERINKEEKI